MNSEVICLRSIPYGFYEKELNGYFKQFGTVKRVRVMRSKRGHPTGVAYVKFDSVEVAEIAAETMDNYLLAENRIRCNVLKVEKVPKCISKGGLFVPFDKPNTNTLRHAQEMFATKTEKQEKNIKKRLIAGLTKRMLKLKEMGIDYEFEIPSE